MGQQPQRQQRNKRRKHLRPPGFSVRLDAELPKAAGVVLKSVAAPHEGRPHPRVLHRGGAQPQELATLAAVRPALIAAVEELKAVHSAPRSYIDL